MLVLLKKDFLVNMKIGLLLFAFNFFMGQTGYITNEYIIAQLIFISIVSFSTINIINNLITIDDKHNTDILFNSLPLERKPIVISKYLGTLILPIIYSISLYAFTRLYKRGHSIRFYLAPRHLLTFEFMIFSIAVTILCLSLYFPIYYLSAAKSVTMLGIFIISLPPLLLAKFTENFEDPSILTKYIGNININIAFLMVSLILYSISLQLSIAIYSKKEF